MDRVERKSRTLGTMFLRYVLFMIIALAVFGLILLVTFNLFIKLGMIYPANYAETQINDKYQEILDTDKVTADIIPEPCRFVIFSKDGTVLDGDIPEDRQVMAWNIIIGESGYNNYFYKIFDRENDYVVLEYSIKPQYKSEFLREHFIQPQVLLTIIIIIGGISIIIISSSRFGKKMKKKIVPVMDAVEKIKTQDLEFDITYSGVKEIDDCLSSIDDMKNELRVSLEKQWNTEHEKTRQMSALAHDIKTPLTVVRGNAELLGETELTEEQKYYTDYISDSAMKIQNYIGMLLQITKTDSTLSDTPEKTQISKLLNDIKNQSTGLTEPEHKTLNWNESYKSEFLNGVYDQIVRAVMNVIKNATEHTKENGTIEVSVEEKNDKLTFVVEDSGEGFSAEALLHGTEQFFMEDKSRTDNAHYGIGLFSAKQVAEKHGGSITLSNSDKLGGGKVVVTFARGL